MRIENGDNNLGALDGLQRLDDTEFLDRLPDSGPAPNACRVDQEILSIIAFERHCYAVPRRAGLIEHNESFFAEQAIRERRFADVRPTYDRNTQRAFIVIVGTAFF